MRLSRFVAFLVAGSLVSVASIAKADNIVANPTFTGGTNSGPNYVGYGVIPSWTSPDTFVYSGDPGATGSGSAAGTPFDSPGLPAGASNAGFIQTYTGGGGGTTNDLSQLLTTVAGQKYDFSFLENARACCGGTDTLTATITGTGADFSETSSVSYGSWVLVSGSFVASSTTEDLEFLATLTGGSDGTVLVTDATVSATPEPSGLILLGTGLIGLAGAARRRMNNR